MTRGRAGGRPIGAVVADLEISRAWLVDPASGREGPGEIVVTRRGPRGGRPGSTATRPTGSTTAASSSRPGSSTSTPISGSPATRTPRRSPPGLAAAAHGGFTTVCLMPNTTPALDDPAVLARVRAAAVASRVAGPGAGLRRGHGRARGRDAGGARASWPTPASSGSPTTARGVASAALVRNALAVRGRARAADRRPRRGRVAQTAGAEANDGFVATVLGLRGWPAAAEEAAVARDLAILADVVRDVPAARLHLTHLSTAGALDLVRRAKAAGLPVTCDVTPHHLALTDEWLAGARRWAWEATGDPWADGDGAIVAAPYASSLRVNPPLRSPSPTRPRAARRCSTGPPTRSRPTTRRTPSVDKDVEFGLAANGISGIETALGVVLAAVDAGLMPLARAIEALTVGPGAGARRRAGAIARHPASSRARRPISSSSTDRRRGRSRPMRSRRAARTRRWPGASCRASSC